MQSILCSEEASWNTSRNLLENCYKICPLMGSMCNHLCIWCWGTERTKDPLSVPTPQKVHKVDFLTPGCPDSALQWRRYPALCLQRASCEAQESSQRDIGSAQLQSWLPTHAFVQSGHTVTILWERFNGRETPTSQRNTPLSTFPQSGPTLTFWKVKTCKSKFVLVTCSHTLILALLPVHLWEEGSQAVSSNKKVEGGNETWPVSL